MIWATVGSQSCFCWLYRASPSLAEKNIISLILVSTIWWWPCVESSLVLLEEVKLKKHPDLNRTLRNLSLTAIWGPSWEEGFSSSSLHWCEFKLQFEVYLFQQHKRRHIYNGILLSYKKEHIWISSDEVDKTRAYYTEWSRSEKETPIQYINTYIWNLERW